MSNMLLKVDHLDKRFGGIHAVNDVSFEIAPGEILGLIGPNGSGKSTTVNLIRGDIFFEGHSKLKKSTAKRAQLGIGRTFQTPKAFNGLTVFDSVFTIALQKYGFRDAEEKASRILQEFGLIDMRLMFSEKLPIEKRKQLDLARIMAIDPKFIMLDEVMAGLNPSEMEECIALVKKIRDKGVTILFIEHVMRAVTSLCERVIVLADGLYLSGGDPQVVLKEPKVIEAYLGKGKHDAGAE